MSFFIKQKNEAIRWARYVLDHKDQYVIFDTETTGLKESDVIIHFAVMDLEGNMLIDSFVKPMSKRRISADAQYINGITMKQLKGAPLFEDIVSEFIPIANSKKLLVYNADFHARMFDQTYYNEGVTGEPITLNCLDVKDHYVKFSGISNAALPGRRNTGIGDCLATLAVIQKMAKAEMEEIPVSPLEAKKKGVPIIRLIGWILAIVGSLIFGAKVYLIGFIMAGVGVYLISKPLN